MKILTDTEPEAKIQTTACLWATTASAKKIIILASVASGQKYNKLDSSVKLSDAAQTSILHHSELNRRPQGRTTKAKRLQRFYRGGAAGPLVDLLPEIWICIFIPWL